MLASAMASMVMGYGRCYGLWQLVTGYGNSQRVTVTGNGLWQLVTGYGACLWVIYALSYATLYTAFLWFNALLG
jgi:hypothetical protein